MAVKRYNNKSKFFADWTTKKLKDEAISYDELINGEASCYGRRDMMAFDGIMNALRDRGIEGITKLVFK